MRFQVPQFINVEDKIFGALSAKQFIYIAGGGGIAYVLLKLLPTFIAIVMIIPIVILSLALAFLKINQKPFIFIMESAFKYFINKKLYTWQRDTVKTNHQNQQSNKIGLDEDVFAPKLSESKLKDLSWSLDINKGVEKPKEN